MLIALLLVVPNVWDEAESFWKATPNVVRVVPQTAWRPETAKDPRRRLAAFSGPPKVDPAKQKRVIELSEEIDRDYPNQEPERLMKDPRYQELLKLLQPDAGQQAQEAARDRLTQEIATFDAQTLRWVRAEGYDKIRGWQGRMVMLAEGAESQSVTIVDWKAENRFWASSYGRQMWTGGYTVSAAIRGPRPVEPRTVDRPGRNFAQMHLGQEGWYIKFTPIAFGSARIPLPTLWNGLRNLPLLETAQTTANIGDLLAPAGKILPDTCVLGYPLAGKTKEQVGGVESSTRSGRVRIAWRFAPI